MKANNPQCALAGCNKIIRPPRKRFCCNSHKDLYHNRHNPRGFFAHLNTEKMDDIEYYNNTTHPFDSDALGQE